MTGCKRAGGGRIDYSVSKKSIFVYGYSNQFGAPPNLQVVLDCIKSDSKYKNCKFTCSLDGY